MAEPSCHFLVLAVLATAAWTVWFVVSYGALMSSVTPPDPEILSAIAENLDRQMLVSVRGRRIADRLYVPARERQGGEPLTLLFARRLIQSVRPGDVVLINTGWVQPTFDYWSENDGLLGGALLARLLARGLKARPIFLVEESVVPTMEAVCWAAGLVVMSEQQLIKHNPEVNRAAAVSSFPIESQAAAAEASRLLDELKPAAILAVEKAGPSRGGGVPHDSWVRSVRLYRQGESRV